MAPDSWKSFNGDVAEHESGWVPFVPGGSNEHLTAEARVRAEAAYQAEQERRGAALGRVVVDVYENAAVPHVQGTNDPRCRGRTCSTGACRPGGLAVSRRGTAGSR